MKHLLFVNQNHADILPLVPFVEAHEINVSLAHSIQEALSLIRTHNDIDIIIADTKLPDGHGLDLIKEDALSAKLVKQFFLAGEKSEANHVESNEEIGTHDFLEKPITIAHLKQILQSVSKDCVPVQKSQLDNEVDEFDCGPLVGRSPAMQRLYHLIKRVAKTSATAFVIGKSGTGKELVAEAIYRYSNRFGKPWIAINCGAISPDLVCSALFGHEKGSFTGASQSHKGYFEQASGGTIFLDEITETSLDLQVKLLRVLETGTIIPVGGKRKVKVDVRVIASTNRCPRQAVKDGVLREDLYYRLNVFPLYTPPLNSREGDIALLAQHFLNYHNRHDDRQVIFSPAAIEVLNNLVYAGNVRELKNLVHRAYILADDVIDVEHLNLHPLSDYVKETQREPLQLFVNTPLQLAQKQYIQHTLRYYEGDEEAAAVALDISLRELRKLLKSKS